MKWLIFIQPHLYEHSMYTTMPKQQEVRPHF